MTLLGIALVLIAFTLLAISNHAANKTDIYLQRIYDLPAETLRNFGFTSSDPSLWLGFIPPPEYAKAFAEYKALYAKAHTWHETARRCLTLSCLVGLCGVAGLVTGLLS